LKLPGVDEHTAHGIHATLLSFASWLAKKLLAGALVAGLALAAYGGWMNLQDEGGNEQRRLEKLQRAAAAIPRRAPIFG
jgi:hypothetical protein